MVSCTDVSETCLYGDYGETLGITVSYQRCHNYVEVFGVDEPSKRRAPAMLRDEYPLNESHFYVVDCPFSVMPTVLRIEKAAQHNSNLASPRVWRWPCGGLMPFL
jgi:hypothetical protein